MNTVLKRESLYVEVWAQPISVVSKRYGLSGNGLKKICHRLGVPVPPRGYWAKRAAGKPVTQPPLPPATTPSTYRVEPQTDAGNLKLPEDDAWVAEQSALDLKPGLALKFVANPRRWHTVIETLRASFEEDVKELTRSKQAWERHEKLPDWRKRTSWDPNTMTWSWARRHGGLVPLSHRARPFRFSMQTWTRGLAAANSLALYLERRGYSVAHDEGAGRIGIEGHGGRVRLRIVERTEKKSEDGRGRGQPAEEIVVATGLLRLGLEAESGTAVSIDETPDRRLESRADEIVRAIRRLIIRSRTHRRKLDAWRREREEQDQRRREAEEAQRARDNQAREERRKVEGLVSEAERWEKAALLRRYIHHLASTQPSAPDSRASPAWLEWATRVADQIDPCTAPGERG